jgi:hypothetical protein
MYVKIKFIYIYIIDDIIVKNNIITKESNKVLYYVTEYLNIKQINERL